MTAQKLFGTDGIRGHAEKLFTDEFCVIIGRCFSQYLLSLPYKGSIAIGADNRVSSDRIKTALISGLNHPIEDQGIIPTPALNYYTKIKHMAGLMITGSHISEEENGVKFFFGDKELPKTEEAKLENIISQNKDNV